MLISSAVEAERKLQAEQGRLMANEEDSDLPVLVRPKPRSIYTPELKDSNRAEERIPKPYSADGKKEFVAKGHDAVLKAVQERGTTVKLQTAKEEITGVIVARDRYTISIRVHGETDARIYYKAHVIYFQPNRASTPAAN